MSTASRATAIALMDNVIPSGRWGATSGVPEGIPVAQKNGWLPLSDGDRQINSVGWVRGQGRSYVLAILTTGNPADAYGIETADTNSRAPGSPTQKARSDAMCVTRVLRLVRAV